MIHIPSLNHYTPEHKLYAVLFQHPATKTIIELRHDPTQAGVQKGWDPITWGVPSKQNLDEWAGWLDHCGVKRSRVLMGIKGWVLCCEDPDGRMVRMYCEEEHEWTDNPDQDDEWLGKPVGVDEDLDGSGSTSIH